jgi:CubicO group peptidase (beta-lactamase class C family)
MSDTLLEEIAYWIDQGVAPGGAVALLAPGVEPITFARGFFAGHNSPSVSPDTMYDLASITKLFTTAQILRLHERGKLSIYDDVGKYLSNFRHSNIRIIDLLTHRLGIDLSLAQLSQEFHDADTFLSSLLELVPPTDPLDHIVYANLQLVYAGAIIEHVTGRTLRETLHQLTRAIGLKHTYTSPDIAERHRSVPPTEVIGDTVVQGVTHDESSRRLGGIAGHAGVFSSVTDLAQFGQAWLDGRIISRSLADELVFKNYDPAGSTPQALGWWLRITQPDGTPKPTPGIYSHTGFTGSLLAINPNNGKVAAFTCNRTYYGRDNKLQRYVWQRLITWLEP